MKKQQLNFASLVFFVSSVVFFWGAVTNFDEAIKWVVYGSFGIAMLTCAVAIMFIRLLDDKKRT